MALMRRSFNVGRHGNKSRSTISRKSLKITLQEVTVEEVAEGEDGGAPFLGALVNLVHHYVRHFLQRCIRLQTLEQDSGCAELKSGARALSQTNSHMRDLVNEKYRKY